MMKTPANKKRKPRNNYFFREWRLHRGLTQEELGALVGITTSSVSQIENGKHGFTDSTLEAFADALDCSPGDILMIDPRNADSTKALWVAVDGLSLEKKNVIVSVVETMLKAS
jgi:transcriptional regulator with XRE-family HTH domain